MSNMFTHSNFEIFLFSENVNNSFIVKQKSTRDVIKVNTLEYRLFEANHCYIYIFVTRKINEQSVIRAKIVQHVYVLVQEGTVLDLTHF